MRGKLLLLGISFVASFLTGQYVLFVTMILYLLAEGNEKPKKKRQRAFPTKVWRFTTG